MIAAVLVICSVKSRVPQQEEDETGMEFEAFAVFQVGELYDIHCSEPAEGSLGTAG
jgi:hypothetical protein